jgi:hypothetical protein
MKGLPDIFLPLFGLVVAIFYAPLLLTLLRSVRARQIRKRFFHAVLSVLARNQQADRTASEIKIVHKKLCERFPTAAQQYRSSRDALEDFFTRVSSIPANRFKELYGLDVSDADKERIIQTINVLKEEDPFGSVSSKHGNLLNLIYQALESANKDLGRSSLRQLADDIEILEGTITVQGRRNLVSTVISVVGVILTLVFGALTVIELLSRPSPQGMQTQKTNAMHQSP